VEREGAAYDDMSDVIYAAPHDPVPTGGKPRLWPVRDVNEALFILMSTAAAKTVLPDLRHRWKVKMTFSWISAIAFMAGFLPTQFAGTVAQAYPTLSRIGIAVGAVLFCISAFATHQYWRMDR